jgi:hypothetical protein
VIKLGDINKGRLFMEWSDKWGDVAGETELKEKVNDVVNLSMERAKQAEAKTEEVVGLLRKLYEWCCGQADFPIDAPVPRKIKTVVGEPKPETFTLLDNGEARIRSMMLNRDTMRMMVIDNRDGSHVAFTLTLRETEQLATGLAQMWQPKDPLT